MQHVTSKLLEKEKKWNEKNKTNTTQQTKNIISFYHAGGEEGNRKKWDKQNMMGKIHTSNQ